MKDELMGFTEIDIENRWTSKYRGMCPLPASGGGFDSRSWRDNQLPTDILTQWCKRHLFCEPRWISNHEVEASFIFNSNQASFSFSGFLCHITLAVIWRRRIKKEPAETGSDKTLYFFKRFC